MNTYQALTNLLSKPDPSDLVGRGHRLTQPGKPNRHEALPGLIQTWIQYRYIERENAKQTLTT